MYSVIILPVAADDIRQIALWYNQKHKGLGKRFIEELREVIKYLKQDPKSAAIRYDEVRVAVLKIFPFMRHYTIDEINRTLIIAAVFHTSRNPDIWKSR